MRAVVLFADGEALLIDRLTSPRPRTVDWVCQLPGKVETSTELPEVATPFGQKCGYDVLQAIRGAEAPPGFALTVRHPGRGVRVVPVVAPGTMAYLAQGRMGTSEIVSPVVLLRREGVTEPVFATLLQPFTTEPPAQGRVAVVQADGKVIRVEVVTAGRLYQVSLIEDGAAARVIVE